MREQFARREDPTVRGGDPAEQPRVTAGDEDADGKGPGVTERILRRSASRGPNQGDFLAVPRFGTRASGTSARAGTAVPALLRAMGPERDSGRRTGRRRPVLGNAAAPDAVAPDAVAPYAVTDDQEGRCRQGNRKPFRAPGPGRGRRAGGGNPA